MARRTTNLELYVWDLRTDKWKHSELAENWDIIDENIWTGKNQIEILSEIPSTGNFAGRLIMLSASASGYPAWSVLRYDGTTWKSIGAIEVQSYLPDGGNYAGRFVLVSQEVNDSPAWSLFVHTGTAWKDVGSVGIKEEDVLVSETRRINFQDGDALAVDVVRDEASDRVDVKIGSTAETSITVREDGATVGSRRILNFRDSASITIGVEDQPNASQVDLTFAADINTSGATNVPQLIGYNSYNPGSITTSVIQYEPVASQSGTPSQSPFTILNQQQSWGLQNYTAVPRYAQPASNIRYNFSEWRAGTYGSDMDPSKIQQLGYEALDRSGVVGGPGSFIAPASAQTFVPLPLSSTWQHLASMSVTFTTPNSGIVMINYCAVPNIVAVSPREQRRVQTSSKGTVPGATYYTIATPNGPVGNLTYEQAAAIVADQMASGQFPAQAAAQFGTQGSVANAGSAFLSGNVGAVAALNQSVSSNWINVTSYASGTGRAIYASDPIYRDLSDAQIQWGLMEGDYLIPGTEISADSAGDTGYGSVTRTACSVIVAGLTPGQSKTWKWVWRIWNPYERAQVKGALFAGGNVGPATLEVWSLA